MFKLYIVVINLPNMPYSSSFIVVKTTVLKEKKILNFNSGYLTLQSTSDFISLLGDLEFK